MITFGLALSGFGGLVAPCFRFFDGGVGEVGRAGVDMLVFKLGEVTSPVSMRRFFEGASPRSSGTEEDRLPYVRSGLFRVRNGGLILLHG